MRLTAVLSTILLVALALPVLAEQEFRAGGLVFKEPSSISIAREDVYISAREIRVHYAYAPSGDEAQTVTMGFQLPPVPLEDGVDYLGGVLDDLADPRNYLQFEAVIAGERIPMQTSERAFLNGFDVTEELKAAGVPLFLTTETKAEALSGLDAATLEQLLEHGFFYPSDEGAEFWQPLWHYQTVYEWEQEFAPGAITEIDIRYVPLNGYRGDIGTTFQGGDAPEAGTPPDTYHEPGIRAEYCIDDGLIKAVKKRSELSGYEVVLNGFKLAAPGNENIESFTLTVDKLDAVMDGTFAFVSFCPLGAEKISETAFRWTAEYFTPVRDIAVVYYAFHEPAE